MLDIVTTAFDQHVVWFIELWLKVLDIVTTAFDQHVVWFTEHVWPCKPYITKLHEYCKACKVYQLPYLRDTIKKSLGWILLNAKRNHTLLHLNILPIFKLIQ